MTKGMKLITRIVTIGEGKKYKPFGKKIIRTTNLKYDLSRFAIGGMFIFCALLCLRCHALENRNKIVETILSDISGENVLEMSSNDLLAKTTEIKEEYTYAQSLISKNDELNEKISNLLADIVELDDQNIKLVDSNNEYYKELTTLRERSELYDEFEYVFTYEGQRTDITFDQLKTGIDVCNENDIDPHLLFAFIMTESHGISDAENPKSTATGYGQLLNRTAKFVYEDLMYNGEGTFKNAISKDGETNIEMTARYIGYLRDNTNSVKSLIAAYAGEENPKYVATINSWLVKAGTNLETVNKELY